MQPVSETGTLRVMAKHCSICGEPPVDTGTWCAPCWRAFKRVQRAGETTRGFVARRRAELGIGRRVRVVHVRFERLSDAPAPSELSATGLPTG